MTSDSADTRSQRGGQTGAHHYPSSIDTVTPLTSAALNRHNGASASPSSSPSSSPPPLSASTRARSLSIATTMADSPSPNVGFDAMSPYSTMQYRIQMMTPTPRADRAPSSTSSSTSSSSSSSFFDVDEANLKFDVYTLDSTMIKMSVHRDTKLSSFKRALMAAEYNISDELSIDHIRIHNGANIYVPHCRTTTLGECGVTSGAALFLSSPSGVCSQTRVTVANSLEVAPFRMCRLCHFSSDAHSSQAPQVMMPIVLTKLYSTFHQTFFSSSPMASPSDDATYPNAYEHEFNDTLRHRKNVSRHCRDDSDEFDMSDDSVVS